MRKPPEHFTKFVERYPDVGEAHRRLGAAATAAGPLDSKTAALVKLGVAIAAGGEGAGHSAARKALDAGCTADELRHAAILSVTTLGFPSMMRGLAWVEDVLRDENSEG
jgi:alkylhydroperoxidase/carboxymuconolactone decarboxylase family protein YurZ